MMKLAGSQAGSQAGVSLGDAGASIIFGIALEKLSSKIDQGDFSEAEAAAFEALREWQQGDQRQSLLIFHDEGDPDSSSPADIAAGWLESESDELSGCIAWHQYFYRGREGSMPDFGDFLLWRFGEAGLAAAATEDGIPLQSPDIDYDALNAAICDFAAAHQDEIAAARHEYEAAREGSEPD